MYISCKSFRITVNNFLIYKLHEGLMSLDFVSHFYRKSHTLTFTYTHTHAYTYAHPRKEDMYKKKGQKHVSLQA